MARTKKATSTPAPPVTPQHTPNAKLTLKKKTTRSKRAGLIFPVGRIHRKLQEATNGNRISPGASVYLAAVLEYMTAEILEISGAVTSQSNKTRITPRMMQLAVQQDDEFAVMFKDITISQGGVLPKPVHESLLPKKNASGQGTSGAAP